MPIDRSFRAFRQRITRGYVQLAFAIVLLVTTASSVLAFYTYAHGVNEAVAAAARRVPQLVLARSSERDALRDSAPRIVTSLQRNSFRVRVFDDGRHLVAGEPRRNGARGPLGLLAGAFGLHGERVDIPGGVVYIEPDVDRFGRVLREYWSVMIPAGAAAMLVALVLGRNLTARAVRPLIDVTEALDRIAAGDVRPPPISASGEDLAALTTAYNDVAHRVTTGSLERERAEAQMRQFVADAGHELRTPLTIVMGYLDVLDQGIVRDPEAVRRVIETMRSESRRMRVLIDKLIFLARLERSPAPVVEIVDANLIVARVREALAPIAAARIAVLPSPPTHVRADATELFEALRNVVENALKYAPGSPVEISLSGDETTVRVRIADRGPGMDAQDAAHAFDRFYRGSARGAVEGTGLGLAIARRALERCGGAISLESAPGAGVTATLTLRRASPPPRPPNGAPGLSKGRTAT